MRELDYIDWEFNGFKKYSDDIELVIGYDTISNIQFNKFKNLPNLIKLTISDYNNLSLPSDAFNHLGNLFELYLAENGLTTLPASIARLTKLEILLVNNNKITSLPDSIGKLINLEMLRVSNNEITVLPDSIGKLIKLEGLDLDYNTLTTLPDSIGELINLKVLRVNKNNITTLPESIGELFSLQELYLENTQIERLPESFSKLKSLKSLAISNASNRKIKVSDSVYEFIQSNFPSQITEFETEQLNLQLPPARNIKADLRHISSPNKIELFDPILMEPDLKMDTYLKEDPNNMIVISGNSHYALTKDTIRMQMSNSSNIVFECIQLNTLRAENIVKTVKYLRCNSIGLPGDFIDLKQIDTILNMNHQIYEIKKTSKKLNSVVSDAVLNHGAQWVSASHCQEGQGGNVYELIRIFGVKKSSKSRKKRSLSRSKSKKSNTSTYTSKRRKMSNKTKISSSL
jgi:hypothetical protein